MSLFEPDIMNGPTHGGPSCEQVLAERRLMVAILADALDCYQKHMATSNVRRRKLYRDAERWIQSEEFWVFSFRNICAVLDLDADALRDQTRRWRREQLAGILDGERLRATA